MLKIFFYKFIACSLVLLMILTERGTLVNAMKSKKTSPNIESELKNSVCVVDDSYNEKDEQSKNIEKTVAITQAETSDENKNDSGVSTLSQDESMSTMQDAALAMPGQSSTLDNLQVHKLMKSDKPPFITSIALNSPSLLKVMDSPNFFDTLTSPLARKARAEREKENDSDISIRDAYKYEPIFSSVDKDIVFPEYIISNPSGIISKPLTKKDVKLSVKSPTNVKKTPGNFSVEVCVKNTSPNVLEHINLNVAFGKNSDDLSFSFPVPLEKDLTIMSSYCYSFNLNIGRISKSKIASFCVYLTQKKKDRFSILREYMVTSCRHQVNIAKSMPNKAVIVVPGVCGSELFIASPQQIKGKQYAKGDRIWPPEEVMDIIEGDNEYSCSGCLGHQCCVDPSRIWTEMGLIICNEDGTSKADVMLSNPVIDCKKNKGGRYFGTINCYKGLINSILESEYAEDAKVVFFSYDWRMSNACTADALARFVKEHDFSDVILIAHSMGALLCASYLSDPVNCKTTEKLILLGAPLLGAPKAFAALEKGTFFDGVLGKISAPIANPTIKAITKNCASIYELLPPKQLFTLPCGPYLNENYFDDRGYLYTKKSNVGLLRGNYVLQNFERTSNIASSREWSDFSSTFMQRAQEFHDGLYDADTGKLKMIANKVDIYNLVGFNLDTAGGYLLKIEKKSSDPSANRSAAFPFFKCDVISCKEELCNGDGTVPIESATLMGNMPEVNSYYVKNINHMGLMKNTECLRLINNIMSGNPDVFRSKLIEKKCPQNLNKSKSSCFCCCLGWN